MTTIASGQTNALATIASVEIAPRSWGSVQYPMAITTAIVSAMDTITFKLHFMVKFSFQAV
ncbi:hypothetical protein [Burkholderia stagnalis]|uniref:hypothetical protein n=1 Tax=Burkholderia stagnalis TaxID=1503054 RepID=UPI0021AB67A1|nr:hypothetical protein [Burkholderia stagnalis]